jgi:hypothetical protein
VKTKQVAGGATLTYVAVLDEGEEAFSTTAVTGSSRRRARPATRCRTRRKTGRLTSEC